MGTPRPSAPFPPITHQLFCLATALSLLVFLFYLRNAYDLINIYKYLVLNNFKESNKRKVMKIAGNILNFHLRSKKFFIIFFSHCISLSSLVVFVCT